MARSQVGILELKPIYALFLVVPLANDSAPLWGVSDGSIDDIFPVEMQRAKEASWASVKLSSHTSIHPINITEDLFNSHHLVSINYIWNTKKSPLCPVSVEELLG
jgi:hypothetical protein